MAPTRVTYSAHHRPEPRGHLFFDVEDGPATITLYPAASASQEWLDRWGARIADALNREPKYIWLEQSHNGPVYARAFTSPEAFLAVRKEYLDDNPDFRPHYERAINDARRDGENIPRELGDGDTIMRIRLEE